MNKKTNVGMVGLGKLGTPVAVAMATKYHVIGYDINEQYMRKRKYEFLELGPTLQDDFQKYFDDADIEFASVNEMAFKCDLIFVAVQTPHLPKYEGITRVPDERANFDYTWLEDACRNIAKWVRPHQTVAIISTVLPGTMRERILPIFQNKCHLAYNPAFIAMGSTFSDFLRPEFVLLGGDSEGIETVQEFYKELHGKDLCRTMSIESAELCKVAYNTFISMKIAYANTIMEICHKIRGCDVDEIIDALGKATERLLSPRYLRGGMGDGGACHPRDNIAMSWLADELNLSHNLFDDIMLCRERQTEWLAELMCQYHGMPKVILGISFKPETNIVTGSPAVLLANLLAERGVTFAQYDPHITGKPLPEFTPSVFLVACKHKMFAEMKFPVGSVVIDPHRYISQQDGVKVVSVGVGE